VTIKFVDVYGFAGGFSCGAAQEGMTLVGKKENKQGFGIPLMEANRKLLGNEWQAQASLPAEWTPIEADGVIGTPPCSAFSSMTAGSKMHGMDSEINNCMRDIMTYAAKVKPQFVCMESVAQAYTKGLPLMRELGRYMNEHTGLKYHVTHVLQNNWSVGGVSKRKRYFLVLTQFPFGVEHHPLGDKLPVLGDALRDLVDQPISWSAQPYLQEPTWWSESLRSESGKVDGHVPAENAYSRRVMDLASVEWKPGESEAHVLKRYYETYGQLPESWQYPTAKGTTTRDAQLIARNFDAGGFSKPRHWAWSEPARVVNGAGPYMVWHPNQRFATHREVARIMGFPDDWLIEGAKDASSLHAFWGKGTSVAPARWLLKWVKASLEGNPGTYTGEELDQGDKLIDVSMDWKPVWKRQQEEALAAA
jgi:site-specific DNA-cytosine methylase